MTRALLGGQRRIGFLLAGAALVAVPLLAVPAQAQWIGSPGGGGAVMEGGGSPSEAPPPTLSSPAMSSPSMGAPGRAPGGVDCQGDVNTLRADIEKQGGILQAAAKKKLPPGELCPLFRRFVSAQEKFYGYLQKNKTACGVPDDGLATLKKNTSQVAGTRDKVCKAAQMAESGGPSGPPPQGQLSQGLGLPSGLPSVNNAKPGGVFDTLGGNALR